MFKLFPQHKVISLNVLILFIPFLPEAQNSTDSLLNKWQQIKNDTNSLKKTELLIELGKSLNYSYPDSAIFYYQAAIDTAHKNNLSNQRGRAISGIGGVHYIKGQYDYAMENFMEALEIWKENDYRRGKAVGLNNIGLIQNMQEHYKQSIKNHKKALKICKSIHDTTLISHNLFNMGISFHALDKYDSALMYAEKAWNITKEAGMPKEGYRIDNLIGNIYADKGEYSKALDVYSKVIDAENYNNKWELSYAMAGLAKVFKNTGELNKSIDYGLRSYELAKEVGAKWDKQNITKILSEAFAKKGNYKNAYQYHKLHKKYSDSIFNEERENTINYLRLKRQESQNKALEKENRLKESRITTRNYQLIAGLSGIVALIVVVFLLYRNNYLKAKFNENLRQKNNEIASKNKKLTESNKSKDMLFRVIAHDLKTPISLVVSYTDVITEDFDEYEREELLDIIQKLNYSSNEGLRLLENLMEWARSQTGAIAYEPQPVNIKKLIEENINLLITNAENKSIKLTSKLESDTYVHADYNLASTVVRNLISNAIKFTPENGEIVIETSSDKNKRIISVTDTGMGIKKEDQAKLFEVNETNKRKGTRNERGTGLGLAICKEFIEKQNGNIWVESEEGKGSTFNFTLPISNEYV